VRPIATRLVQSARQRARTTTELRDNLLACVPGRPSGAVSQGLRGHLSHGTRPGIMRHDPDHLGAQTKAGAATGGRGFGAGPERPGDPTRPDGKGVGEAGCGQGEEPRGIVSVAGGGNFFSEGPRSFFETGGVVCIGRETGFKLQFRSADFSSGRRAIARGPRRGKQNCTPRRTT